MNEREPIEQALERMRPAELPPGVMARLTAARPHATENTGRSAWHGVILRWLLPVAAGACVAAGTFFLLERNRPPGPLGGPVASAAPGREMAPVENDNYLVGARSVGIVVAPDQQPYRLVEVEWLEHETVRTGADGAALHTATTRRDVIPVALTLY